MPIDEPKTAQRRARPRHAVLVAACAILLAACEPTVGTNTPEPTARAKPVRVAPVTDNDSAQVYSLTGMTRAARRAQLAFQVSGQLAERPVGIGSTVESGDLVARLTQPELQPAADAAAAALERSSTQLAQAQRDLERVERLVAQNAATLQELENARARRNSLAAERERARAQRQRAQNSAGELRLIAPIDATVEQVFFEPGEFVRAGQPVVALSGENAVEVEIGVPERLLAAVEPKQPAQLTLPFFDDRPVTGTVVRVARSAGRPGELFSAVIRIDDDTRLRAGLSVAWHVREPPQQGLLVPTTAVARPGGTGEPVVFCVRDGKAVPVAVKLGEIVGDRVRVDGDLARGENVVTVGLNNLTAGRAVHVLDD